MKNPILELVIIISLLTFTAAALAQNQTNLESKVVALDSSTETTASKQYCADNEQTMSACQSFIKGFLQGALLTDTAIIKSIESVEPTYAERAFRTRLGKRSKSPTALAGFCLPAGRSIRELASETLDHVKDSELNSTELAKNVYNSLKVDYRCK